MQGPSIAEYSQKCTSPPPPHGANQNKSAAKTAVLQLGQQEAGIIAENTDILYVMCFDVIAECCNTVDKRLAADHADIRILQGLMH